MQQGKKFFNALGVVAGDGGQWLRKQCLILSAYAPADYWLSRSLLELPAWIRANKELTAELAENQRR